MTQKLKINRPILVEGKYDKMKLASLLDANIIITEGFGVFSKTEKLALIKRLAAPRGIIVMTDSDGAGTQIRAYISSALPKEQVIHLYTPRIPGKEKRKKVPSKSGILGVEGIEADCLRKIFLPFAQENENAVCAEPKEGITKAHFFEDGLSGTPGSAQKRDKLAQRLGLPPQMTPNALLAALNILISYSEYQQELAKLAAEESEETL